MKISAFRAFALAACLFPVACNEPQPEPTDEPLGEVLVITATFDNASAAVGKTTWEAGDKVNFEVVKNGSKLTETMSPKSISEDGGTATFEFSKFFPADAEACYAYVVGTGAESFVDVTKVRVPNVNDDHASLFPVMVASADMATKKLKFSAVYSQIRFVTETTGLSHAIIEGRNSEVIARDNLVDVVSGTVEPVSGGRSDTSIQVEISGPGTHCIPVYPGISFPDGYTISVYGTDGRIKMSADCKDALTIEPGKVYAAPEFVEGAPSSGLFDATKVVYSFGMLSDTHIDTGNGQNCQDKFSAALRQFQAQASKDDLDGLDAVCIAGDFTNTGYNGRSSNNSEIDRFKKLYEAVFDPVKVPMVYAVGNHDPYKQWTSSVYSESQYIRTCFGDKYATTDVEKAMRDSYECRHCVVGKYHILAVTPCSSNPVGYPAAVTDWLDKTLKEVTEADPERYVILLTHPMIYDTVYGSLLGPAWVFGHCSDYWYTKGLTQVLQKYPQVMTFSGHLHFPVNDPRSIWQGDFTAFGCGSTRYMAIEDGEYENMSSTTVMKDASEVSSGLLLQFDEGGNARITKMFFSQNVTFDYPWEIAHPAADKSHLQTYNSEKRKAANTAPTLSSLEVSFADAGSSMKTVYAKFAAGQDDEFVHHYVLYVKKGAATLSRKRILADFYKHQWADQMASSWTQNMGDFESGDYTLVLEAYDSWDAVATITKDFKVSAGAVTPATPATLYADVDFTGGTLSDAKGKLKITNHGAALGKVSVTHKGKTASVDAMTASKEKYVECRMTDITSFTAMQEFSTKGFSVEAFYVDRSPGDQVHGIVCGTEYGGWGTAVRATGVPYFIVGDGSRNVYVNIDAPSAASKTELTHIVGVYDFAKKAIRLYVNGAICGQTTIKGPFYPGENDCYNCFCLGADATGAGRGLDFQSVDMVITDAKIYTGVLDDSAVKAAYDAAVAAIR